MPLGADVMDVADQAAPDRVDRVVVQNAVMPLMADGQDLVRLLGDAAHFLALGHAVGHQLFGQHVLAGLHGLDGHRGVQVQRQGDDHRLDVRDRPAGRDSPCRRP